LINSGTENINQEELSPDDLTGSWEKKERSLTAAALTGLFIIGAIYFNVQSFLVTVFTVVYKQFVDIEITGSFIEQISEYTAQLKIPILIAVVITQYLFMLYPSVLIVKRWHTRKVAKYLRIRRCSVKEILLAVLITIFTLPFCYYISSLLMQLLDIPEVIQNMGLELFTANSGSEFVFMVFAIAVTPAVCEEIFFRGYVQRTLERTTGAKSFIWVGIIFGLFHLQPLSLITLSILGILFSFFYLRSKSILPSSAAHFTNNFIALFFLYRQNLYSESSFLSEENLSITSVIASTIVAAGLVWYYYSSTKSKAANTEISKSL
jgi:membrane protease YdiL (CAAX protease family)